MNTDQVPITIAVGVPMLYGKYYMYLSPDGPLKLNVGEYDYGWYSCQCVAVKGKDDADCSFIMEFEDGYLNTRFKKGWKFEDRMNQSDFVHIIDSGQMLYYEGILEDGDAFYIRPTMIKTPTYVTTTALCEQQEKDEADTLRKEE